MEKEHHIPGYAINSGHRGAALISIDTHPNEDECSYWGCDVFREYPELCKAYVECMTQKLKAKSGSARLMQARGL
jgi:hypothetical protein